jgi:hypothetical protein
MVKSATEAGSLPTFHYMDEVEVDGLLELRRLLKDDPALDGEAPHAVLWAACTCASWFDHGGAAAAEAAQG